MKKLMRFLSAALLATALSVTGCTVNPEGGSGASQKPSSPAKDSPKKSAPLKVFATTGYLADTVKNIDPDADIFTMVGPGGDPHTYQPSSKDIQQIQGADVVLWNGLYLEAQMIDQLKSLGDKQLAVGEQLPKDMLLPWPEKDHHGNPLNDPHIWNNPKAWQLVVKSVAKKLGEVRPERASEYEKNAEKFAGEIAKADEEAKKLLDKVSPPRILITGHDAFNYFGKTYNLQIHATDFVSTEAKLSPEELSELAKLIADKKVPVIFQDNQANPQAIKSLKEAVHALGWDVKVSNKELFADSLGAEEGVNTYLGAFNHNVKAVAEALTKS